MQGRAFQRTPEDFTCAQCGTAVLGDGYRNHCPQCLTSRHVDVQPGDRAAACGGLMPLVDTELDHGELVLVQQCNTCSHRRRQHAHTEDNLEVVHELSRRRAREA